MKITDETIEYVAALAKLELSHEEIEKAKIDLGNIIGHMEIMDGLDTKDVIPMDHVFTIKNVFREDVVTEKDNREELLKNAPAKAKDSFMVPKTVE